MYAAQRGWLARTELGIRTPGSVRCGLSDYHNLSEAEGVDLAHAEAHKVLHSQRRPTFRYTPCCALAVVFFCSRGRGAKRRWPPHFTLDRLSSSLSMMQISEQILARSRVSPNEMQRLNAHKIHE